MPEDRVPHDSMPETQTILMLPYHFTMGIRGALVAVNITAVHGLTADL